MRKDRHTMNIVKGMAEWDRLYASWLEDRKPGLIMMGGITYQVMCPFGEDSPVFTGGEMESFYSSTSHEPKDTRKDIKLKK